MKTVILFIGLLLTSINTTSKFFFISEDPLKPLSKENLWVEIKECNIKFPEIVFAQALLESGELKSTVTKLNNNLFGMKYPYKRNTTAVGVRKGYAK